MPSGARSTLPANTSRQPPRPAITPTASPPAFFCIQSSCLGAPRHTIRKSGFFSLISAIISASSSKYPSWVPAITSPGNSAFMFSAAFSATPGFAPKRYTLPPFFESFSIRPEAKSMPGTRALRGVPRIFEAYTTPMPSGSTMSAPFNADISALSFPAAITISEFGVTTYAALRPAASSAPSFAASSGAMLSKATPKISVFIKSDRIPLRFFRV